MTESQENSKPTDKQWQLIEKLLTRSLNEQVKTRRWNWVFRIALLAFLFFSMWSFDSNYQEVSMQRAHTAVIDIQGEIMADSGANATDIIAALRKAFENPHAKAVLLKINSPGGSPVQASMIYDEIMRLKKKHHKKVYSAITDYGASGAYYIAAASDQIYANAASIVGSIGVVSSGFGFPEVLSKIGVERRVLVSGENKVEMDPYLPLKPEEVARFKTLLADIHQQFIADVKAGRGTRLIEQPDTFSGLFWTGSQAVKLGVIDGLASPDTVARDVIKETHQVDYTLKPDFLTGLTDRFGVTLGQGIVQALGLSQHALQIH